MNRDSEILTRAVDQAGKTAHNYMVDAEKILSETSANVGVPYSMADIIALANIMAQDYAATIAFLKKEKDSE